VSDAPTIDEFAESSYQMIVEAIAPAVTGYNSDELYQKKRIRRFVSWNVLVAMRGLSWTRTRTWLLRCWQASKLEF